MLKKGENIGAAHWTKKGIKLDEKTVKRINVNFTGKFFGFVMDKKMNIKKTRQGAEIGYMNFPAELSGKTFTVILIPKDLNRRIYEEGQQVDYNEFFKADFRDRFFESQKGVREGILDFSNAPTKVDIDTDEVKI